MSTTQTVVLAPGNTAADSTVVDVDAGAVVGIGLYVAAGSVPSGNAFVYKTTPGVPTLYADGDVSKSALERRQDEAVALSKAQTYVQIIGPAKVFVRRPVGMNVGVYKEE